ncbi:hypothetical protein ACIGMX_35005 [Streptomyces aquilus]|uniref:hypothetical protein n=1 Tax=Streptomyces aquilus TaxID=2548456 RepID=UPI0037D1D575
MPELSLAEWLFLMVGSAGFIRFGWCLVYLIADAETFTPVWLERLVLLALNARDRVVLAAVNALLAAALRFNSPGVAR